MANTLQEQYNSIKRGEGDKVYFLKQARNLFPQYFNQYSTFDSTDKNGLEKIADLTSTWF
jgi:hypothetical protein